MPDCFVETPDGIILDFNGFDQVVRWDTFSADFETAGIVPPLAPCTIGGTGAGPIVGTYAAYVRFLDRNGNPSNLSPISNQFTPEVTTGTVTDATFESPVVITTDAPHGLVDGQIVHITGVGGNTAANGIFYATVLSSTTFSISLPGSNVTGNGSYIGGGTVTTGVSQIVYTNVEIPIDSKVTKRQILRNKNGDMDTFYVDIETDDLTSDSFTSTATTEDLSNEVPLLDSSGNDLAVVRYGLPPDIKSVAAHHQGRMFAACQDDYAEGCVEVTHGSDLVTGIGVEWGLITFSGRTLNVVGGDKPYEISSLSSSHELQLTEPYTGSTDKFAAYSITPDLGERRSFYWSEAGMPEAFSPFSNRVLDEDPGSGRLSGLMSMRTWIYILAEQRIYRFSFQDDPGTDGFNVTASQRGCVNNRCWQLVEQSAYMLDFLGPHFFSGNDDEAVGTTEIQELFKVESDGQYRINWNARKYFHSVFDPGTNILRWFICLAGYYTPQHALCFNVRLRRWWIEEWAFPIGCSCLGRMNGRPQVFVGTTGRRVLALDRGTLDGPNSGGTVRGSVTSAGLNWIADSTADYPSSGVVGFPVVIVSGTGKGQRRIVYRVVGAKLWVRIPWAVRPDTTSVYQLGGIQWRWKSPWLTWSDNADESERGVALQFRPLPAASEATLDLRVYHDLSQEAQVMSGTRDPVDSGTGIGSVDGSADMPVDTTKANGYCRNAMGEFREEYSDGNRFVAVELTGVQNTARQTIYRIHVEGAQ